MAGIHALQLKLCHFKIFPCREAMDLRFPPMRGGASHAHKLDDLYQIWLELEHRLHCMGLLINYVVVSRQFFCLVCGRLEKKSKTTFII